VIYTIAIDGPAGSGKSTVAKRVARQLGITYLDTGAMYRAITLKILRRQLPIEAGEALAGLLAETVLDLHDDQVWMDGEEVTAPIRSAEVTLAVSAVSSLPMVREALVAKQQAIARGKSIVMDGRDIASKVLPDATLKVFLTASPEVRGKRRWLEIRAKGQEADLEAIIADIARRDTLDSSREHSPLVCTEDALKLDTSQMDLEAVQNWIIEALNRRLKL